MASARVGCRDPDGRDEFLVLLPETCLPDALTVAGRIRAAVAEKEVTSHRISVSTGVVERTPGTEAAELILQADRDMYRQKRLDEPVGARYEGPP